MPDDPMTENTVPRDLEARLRNVMTAKAQGEPVAPADWGVFAARLASTTRRRQRALVGVAGLALVIGALGGYLGEAAAAPVAARAPGPGSTPSTTAPSGGIRSLAPTASGPAVMCPNSSGGSTGASSGPSATNGSGDIGSATHVFTRTTADGVTVRVYQDATTGVSCIGVPTPMAGSGANRTPATTTAPEPSGSASSPLFETGPNVSIELSDGDAVGQGAIAQMRCVVAPDGGVGGAAPPPGVITNPTNTGPTNTGPVTTGPTNTVPTNTGPPTTGPTNTQPVTATTTPPSPGQPRQLSTGTFGIVEGDPVWWVAVEVGTEVTSVRMTYPDGAADEMAPVSGVAVLAHKVAPALASADAGPYEVRGTLELLGAGGSVLDTVTLPQQFSPVPVPTPMPLQPATTVPPTTVPGNAGLQGGAGSQGGAGTQAVAPNVVEVCPPMAVEPQAQSSATTENR
jgi:hypothetical protein